MLVLQRTYLPSKLLNLPVQLGFVLAALRKILNENVGSSALLVNPLHQLVFNVFDWLMLQPRESTSVLCF